MLSSIDRISVAAYSAHAEAIWRRTATSNTTVSHTAAIAVIAYERASTPAHVTRGRIAKMIPAVSATVRVDNNLPRTTTPAAAAPTARLLGARAQNSLRGNRLNHSCIAR